MTRHPHCELRITRSIAPSDLWHWCVVMPDGHPFNVSSRFVSVKECMDDAAVDGLKSLLQADGIWHEQRGGTPHE